MLGEYLGHTENFRTTKDSYEEKKQTKNPMEDWARRIPGRRKC